jgi:hypothetical protein
MPEVQFYLIFLQIITVCLKLNKHENHSRGC